MIRLVSWNVQGRAGPDPTELAAVLRASRPDVIALQEIHRRQAREVARTLGWQVTWAFKHWPVVVPAEGLAVLTPVPPWRTQRRILAAGWRWWSWRRRVALVVEARTPAGRLHVVDVHLGAHVGDDERRRQAALAIELLGGDAGVVAGDLNAVPGDRALEVFGSAGFVDAWEVVRGDAPGPTNWEEGPRDGPPTQRLDYVWARGWSVDHVTVPAGSDALALAGLSDHLPLTAVLTTPTPARA